MRLTESRAAGSGKADFLRVAAIAGATVIAVIALLLAKPVTSAMTAQGAAGVTEVDRSAVRTPAEIETVSFVTSPSIETNPQFFFGTGDGSNGYYAERPR
jgi:hypothetical protein